MRLNASCKIRCQHNLCEFRCLSALEILNNCEVKKRQLSYKALYRCQERSGIYLAQNLKRNIVCWIKVSPLDAKDTALSKVINDASRIPKQQKQWWNGWTYIPACANFGYFYIFNHCYFGTSKVYIFFLECEGKIKILRDYYRDNGPNLYTGPWALFDDMDASKEK